MKRVMPAVGLVMFLLLVPALLYSLMGPPSLPNMRLLEIADTLSGPFLSPDSVIHALGLFVWALWVYLAVVCVLRVIAVIGIQRGSSSGRWLLAATSRMAPGVLLMAVDLALGTVLLLGPVSSGRVEASAPVRSNPTGVWSAPANGADPPIVLDRSYVVRPGDSLWRIAERELGSGDRWPEIFALNQGRTFSDGRTFTNPRLIRPNWILSLPLIEVPPPPSAPASNSQPTPTQPSPVVRPADPKPSQNFAPIQESRPEDVHVATPKTVVRLPSGVSLAASFASGILASHALASLRRRRHYRPSVGVEEGSGVEARLVLDLRRAQLVPTPSRLDSAVSEVVAFWKSATGRVPTILSAMESEDRVVFQIDGDEIELDSTVRVRISQAERCTKAEIRKPFIPIEERPSPVEGSLLIPVGATGPSILHVGLLASVGASVVGDESSSFTTQLILSSVVGRGTDQIEVVFLGDLVSFGRLVELPHIKSTANWLEAERVLQELHLETIARARAFEERDAEGIQRYVATEDPQSMPAILVVCTNPPKGTEGLLAGLATQLSRFGGAFVALGWTPIESGTTLTASEGVLVEANFPLEKDRLQSLMADDETADELLDILQGAYGSRTVDEFEAESEEPQVIDITEKSHQSTDTLVPDATSTPITVEPVNAEVSVAPESLVTVRAFGRMTVSRRERVIRKGWRMRSRELLAYLIAHPQGTQRDEIIRIFWPDIEQRKAERLLRDSIFRLRDLFVSQDEKWIEGYVHRKDTMIVLEKERWSVDVWRFEDLVTSIRSVPDEEVAPRLWEALSIFRGDFCEYDDYPWVEGSRERYRNLLITAAAQLAERLDASGDQDEAIRVLDRALGFVPLCEDLYRRVISLEAKAGRKSEAEVRYQQLISKLADELGEDPDPETENLMRKVRRGRSLIPEVPNSRTQH